MSRFFQRCFRANAQSLCALILLVCTFSQGCTPATDVNPVLSQRVQPCLFIGTAHALYRSEDQGQTWQDVDTIGGAIFTSIVSNNQYVFVASSRGVTRSSDGGISWALASSGLPDSSIVDIAASEFEI